MTESRVTMWLNRVLWVECAIFTALAIAAPYGTAMDWVNAGFAAFLAFVALLPPNHVWTRQ